MGAIVLNFLRPYLLQLAIGGALALAAGGGFVALKVHYQNVGYARAVHDVAVQNQEAVDAVNTARARVRDCNSRDGMRWDQVAGECVGRD